MVKQEQRERRIVIYKEVMGCWWESSVCILPSKSERMASEARVRSARSSFLR